MTALATAADLEARLGRELTDLEAARAEALLADASATIRGYVGQTITSAETTDKLRTTRGTLRLPQRPVTEVTEVLDLYGNVVSYTWPGGDTIYLQVSVLGDWAYEPVRTGPMTLEVTYTHGYAAVPDDLVGVCASIVLRALGQSPTMGGLTQEAIEGYSYSIGTTGAAGGLGVLPAEREILDRYRRRAGYVDGTLLL